MKGNARLSGTAVTSVTEGAPPITNAASRGAMSFASTATAAVVVGGQLYRRPTVLALTGISGATLDRMIRAGTFPQPIKLGARSVAWRSADIASWMATLSREG